MIIAKGDGDEIGFLQETTFYWGANSMQFLDSIWGFDTTCPDESFLRLVEGEEDDDFEEEDDEDYSDDDDEESEEDDFEADDDDFMDDDDEDDDNEEENP